jgi:hypothetical protein
VWTYQRRRHDRGTGGQSLIAELQVKPELKKPGGK